MDKTMLQKNWRTGKMAVMVAALLLCGTVRAQVSGVVVDGSVFGAGKGLSTTTADTTVARVHGTSTVEMSTGWVKTNVYGGGEMATVGLFHYAESDEATTYNDAHTGIENPMLAGDVIGWISGGTTTVTVSGGTVGPDNLDPTNINGHGNVFGGGLGMAGRDYSNFAYVNTANVTISNTGTVRGSVFGGGENGHVQGNTSVTISGGTVGVRLPHDLRDISSDAGSSNPVYAGNVYGGGRGVDHTAVGNHLSETAGRVYGNTSVSVTGGQIHHSVYGGGSLASVGTYVLKEVDNIYGGHIHEFAANTGDATVSVSGGRIGPTWAELLLDDEGNSLVDGDGDPNDAAAAAAIAANYECLGENEGHVYGSGRGVNHDPNSDNVDDELYVEMAFTNNTTVTISGTADVVGSVFGGGENGHVKGNTQVNIQGGTIGGIPLHHNGFDLPGHSEGHGHVDDGIAADDELGYNETGIGRSVFRGNVYGGGRGIDHTSGEVTESAAHIFSVSAGRVYGNTAVNVTGGRIYHNVFGGGSIASVGTYSYPSDGAGGYNFFANPEAVVGNTGTTTVTISGGQVGVMGENEGYVYGGGRGIAGTNETQVSHLAFVNATQVNIQQTNSTHADVRASVFGGGMNGHVLTNTQVNVSGGVIGGKTAANYASGAESYDPTVFTAVPASVDYTINGIEYYSGIRPGDTITNHEGLAPHTVFLGNVYGGGRGVDVTSGSRLSYTAGRVYGNTEVNITGGVIYHSVFGGGSIASVGTYELYSASDASTDAADPQGKYGILANQPKVLDTTNVADVDGHYRNEYIGKATVNISAGRIGTNGRNNGYVFGSSRGMAGVAYRGLGYVNITHVNISGSAVVRGSVFGSGENGHVLDSTLVTISGGHIGNGKRNDAASWVDNYVGNVYGGGRGLDPDVSDGTTISPFAGRVYRTANVVVTGGQIDNNVYGGGSLASVGRYKRNNNNEITYSDSDKGIARVTISGGTIGIDGDENGHVFGASRGTAVAYQSVLSGDVRAALAYVADARVSVSNGIVKGSVFGGGESGHVQRDARVSVSGGTIGSEIPSDYNGMSAANKTKYDLMGNVYGAGRGIDECQVGANYGFSMSAGYVRGRTIVTITGTPTIHRNVYGGGSMGSVGDYGPYCRLDYWQGDPSTFVRGTEANNYTDASNGVATVVIKGTVGTATDVARHYGGNVYGSCRGMANDPDHDAAYDEFYAYHGGFGEMAYVTGSHVVVDEGANVKGSVYGGGENGHVDFGGTEVIILNGSVAGNVFGGGKGSSTSPTAGIVDGHTHVSIGTEAQGNNTPDANGSYNTVEIGGYVFGGNDSYSSPLGTMTVDVWHTKHTASNKYPTLPVRSSYASDEAFQTAYDAAIEDLKTDGEASPDGNYALKGVYGGGNEADVLSGIATVDASDGNAAHVYDQRYITQRIVQSADGIPAGFTSWPGGISRKSVVNVYGCDENTIKYVYGGGKAATTVENEVNIEGGRIYQVFAGGDGSAVDTKADVGHVDGGGTLRTLTGNDNHGNATVTVKGGIVYQVFGGSNTRGKVYGTTNVGFDPDDECLLVNSDVFGGGNHAEGQGDIVVTIPCGAKLGSVYGCANEAAYTGNVTLNVEGGVAENVFGGSRNASINGNVTVNYYGGVVTNLFGGNDVDGNISGTITVNVAIDPDYNCADGMRLTNVYGGCRDAAYDPGAAGLTDGELEFTSPVVNILRDTVAVALPDPAPSPLPVGFSVSDGKLVKDAQLQNVFGGSYGSGARVTSNPKVVIGNPSGTGQHVTVHGNVYGGGDAASVTGNTYVMLVSQAGATAAEDNSTTVYGNIFGGGYGKTATIDFRTAALADQEADVYASGAHKDWPKSGNTTVDIRGDRTLVDGSIYGGGNAGIVYGNTDVIIGDYDAQTATPFYDFTYEWNGSAYVHHATITTTTKDATIHYTTNGSEPDDGSTSFDPASPIAITPGQTLKSIALRDGYENSEVYSELYKPVSPTPVISYIREGGDIKAVFTMPDAATDKVWYRTGGEDPDADHRTEYNPASKPTVTAGTIVKAYALAQNSASWEYSEVASSTVTLVANPVIAIDDEGHVSITCATAGATIRYTVGDAGGSEAADVTEGSTEWPGTLTLTMNQKIKAVAYKTGMAYSEQEGGTYTATTQTPQIALVRDGEHVVAEITCATSGVTLLYRLGGSNPDPANVDEVNTKTFSSSERPEITDGQTIKAIAVKAGRNNSAVATLEAHIVAAPAIAISSTGMVTITPAAGSTVRYTTNGSVPHEASTEYSAPFQAANFATIKAAGFRDGYTESPVVSERYVPTVATPTITFQRSGGIIKPIIECTTPGSVIHWTTDGTDPTDGSQIYFPASATVAAGSTVKAKAYCDMPYEWNPSAVATAVVAATPATPEIHISADGTSVTSITCATADVTIHYTTDGSTVTESSPVYSSGAISNIGNHTINAVAYKAGMIPSATAIKRPVEAPVVSIASDGTVTMSCGTEGASIRYWNDGVNTPTAETGEPYSTPFDIVNPLVKAIAYKDGEIVSGVTSVTRMNVAAPTITVNNDTRYVVISTAVDGATLRYTTDGNDPSINTTTYTYQFRKPGEVIKAIAVKSGNLSPVTTMTSLPTPTVTKVGTTVTITLTGEGLPAGYQIYYTVDGSTPTTSSHLYSGPFTATIGNIITAYAIKDGYNPSANSNPVNITSGE
jgi:hypothetical protein